MRQLELTESFLRAIEARDNLPGTFVWPTPDEAGLLAAARLKFTDYRGSPIESHPCVRRCERVGWLEVREAAPAEEHLRRLPRPVRPALKLTELGRVVLDATLSVWAAARNP